MTQTIDKKSALDRLTKLESEAAALRKIIDAPEKITDRVKTFEDALAIVGCGDNMKILLAYNGQDKEMIAARAFAMLSIIRAALNEGWEPDHTKANQPKWYPRFKYTAGAGFSFYISSYGSTSSHVGARLSFKSRELSDYAAIQFIDIYRDFLTL